MIAPLFAVGLVVVLGLPGQGQGPGVAAVQRLTKAMEDAQAKAERRGDERLSCEALQKELVANSEDPALQTAFGKMDIKMPYGSETNGQGLSKTPTAVSIFTSLLTAVTSALVPALGGILGSAAAAQQQAQMAAMQARGAAFMATEFPKIVAQIEKLIPIMPQMARSQRLLMLAQQKKCDWLPAEALQ